MKIAFCSGKGGVGKSTLTLLFTAALSKAGRNIAVRDLDPQHSISNWVQSAEDCGQLAVDGENYEIEAIDLPPRLDDPSVIRAVSEADRVIIPCTPSPADMVAGKATAEVVRHFLKPGAKAFLCFNMVQRGTTLSSHVAKLAEEINLPALKNYISRRQCYQHAVVLGWKGLDSAAREELLKVVLEMTSL